MIYHFTFVKPTYWRSNLLDLCWKQPCPAGADSFRDQQCKDYSPDLKAHVNYKGNIWWIPYTNNNYVLSEIVIIRSYH